MFFLRALKYNIDANMRLFIVFFLIKEYVYVNKSRNNLIRKITQKLYGNMKNLRKIKKKNFTIYVIGLLKDFDC